MKTRSPKWLLLLSLSVVVFSVFGATAYAQTEIQIFPTIDGAGYVTASTSDFGGSYPGGAIFGYKNFATADCSGSPFSFGSTNMSNTVLSGGYSMEGGWSNGSGSTADGDYCTEITWSGSAFTPDWSTGTTYYWIASRSGGTWSGVAQQPATDSVSNLSAPTAQSVTATTYVAFSYSYYVASLYDKKGLRLTDVTASQSVSVPEQSIVANGSGTFSYSMVLTSGHLYAATPYIRNSSTGSYKYAGATYFSVVTQAQQNYESIATTSALYQSVLAASSSVQCNTGNLFTDGLCTVGAYLFVPSTDVVAEWTTLPNTISTKFPFSWVYGVQAIFTNLSASSSANMIAPTMDFTGVDPATSTPFGAILPNITVLSSSTIQTYISPTMWATFQTLIAAALWLTFAADVFFTVRNKVSRV